MSIVLNEAKAHFEVEMLGGFHVLKDGIPLFKDVGRSKQVMNLLAYLLWNRGSIISQERLIQLLWPNEDSEDPINALKNLIYRLRKVLMDQESLECDNCVLLQSGTYTWNKQFTCTIDVEVMEALWEEAGHGILPVNDRINLYKKAIALYKGRFMENSFFESWSDPLSSFYQSLYLNCIREVITLLSAQQRYEEIISICEMAIIIEPYEEVLHENLLRALIYLGKNNKALEHYNTISERFYKDLGVKLSASIISLHKDLIRSLNNVETNISTIKKELAEHNDAGGAFLCDLEIFKHFYRLEARISERTGQSIFICLLTLSSVQNTILQKRVLINAMDRLKDALISSLRKGDVVSRFSPTQFILLLSTNHENTGLVIERILRYYSKIYKNPTVKVTVILDPIV